MTLPISTKKLVGGSGLGVSSITILLIFFMDSGDDSTFLPEIAELGKNIEVHAASPGHAIALLNNENLKNDLDKLEDDFKEEFNIVNEKLDKNYRLLCQISNGDCK